MQLLDITFSIPLAIVRTDKYLGYMNKSPATEATPTPDSDIANRIRAVLSDKNLNQETLAQDIGISYSKLRRGLEQHRGDRRSFTVLELCKIAATLNVPASTLVPAELKQPA